MRAYLYALFERVYPKLKDSQELFFVGVPKTKEEAREYFIEAYTSVSTRYIQYEYNFKYPTYVPLIEFSNFTVDQPAPLYRIVNSEGKTLNECTLGYPNCYGLSGLETYMGRPYSDIKG
jgi:hypothetical protein